MHARSLQALLLGFRKPLEVLQCTRFCQGLLIMVDSIGRSDLLKEYSETRTSTRSDEKELLLQHSLAYLTSREAEKRFPKLGCNDLYRELRKLLSNSDSPHGDAILKIKAGFSHLEQYALNLLRSPWRKEFHVIKTYTGFFKCKVQRSLPDTTTAWLITCLGYKQDDELGDHFLLKEPLDVQKIQQMSLYLFLVTVELQIIHEIASFAEPEGYSLKQVIKARYNTVRGANEAKSWLQKESKDESIKKKLKLDRNSGIKEPEGVGQPANKPSVNSRGERTLSSQGQSEQQQNEEASKSRPKGSDRETKFPPSFSTSSFPSDRASTRDISTAHYPCNSTFEESQVEQLTDYQLYGYDGHSAEQHLPASNEEIERTNLSYSNGLLAQEHNTTASQEIPPSVKGEKLYVNLPEKPSAFRTSCADDGLYQSVVIPAPIPGSPPPDYVNQDDYVVIEPMVVDPAEYKSMRTAELSDKKNDGYDSTQFYQSNGTGLSSVSASMSKVFLDPYSTFHAVVDTGSSANGDTYAEAREVMHKAGGGFSNRGTERSKEYQRPASSREFTYSGEPRRSVSYNASTYAVDEGHRYQPCQHLPHGLKDSKQDEVVARIQADARGSRTSDRSRLFAGEFQTSLATAAGTICEFCSVEYCRFVCNSCFKMSCERCQEIFNTDFCVGTILPHKFIDMQNNRKSSKKAFARHRPPVPPTESPKTWQCLRCTYVNPADSKICTMCATTRGMSQPEMPKPGSHVCRNCTYCSKEGSDVCQACGKSLHLETSETSV